MNSRNTRATRRTYLQTALLLIALAAFCTDAVSAASAGAGNKLGGQLPAGLNSGEWASIRQRIDAERYQVAPVGESRSLRSDNPAQGLALQFTDRGLSVAPLPVTETVVRAVVPAWASQLRTRSIGRKATAAPELPVAAPTARGNRVEFELVRGVREWYVNGANGIEHGYTLDAPPSGDRGEVSIELALEGDLVARATDDGDGIRFEDRTGVTKLRYEHLLVEDADGHDLPARIEVTDAHRFRIVFDDAQAAYPVTVDPLIVNERQKIFAADGANSDNFGLAVSLSGDTLLATAHNHGGGRGTVYVFVRFAGSWVEQARLTPEMGDRINSGCQSVSLSGDTAAIPVTGQPSGDDHDAGRVYVFRRTNGVWSREQIIVGPPDTFDHFGCAVAVEGNTLLIGALGDDIAGRNSQGSAYVYVRDAGTWAAQAKLVAAEGRELDSFGFDVALSGERALIGAPSGGLENNNAAYVFVRSGTTWMQEARLLPPSGGNPGKHFGEAVAISGDTAVVGAWTDDLGRRTTISNPPGSATVFVRTGSTWSRQARLIASRPTENPGFGISVSLQGDTALVGMPFDDLVSLNEGSARLFRRFGSSWSEQRKLVTSERQENARLGQSVALSGETAVGGAFGSDGVSASTGAAFVFDVGGFVAPTLDFGDARDPRFPTLLENDGARHQVGSFFLGASVDPELDGEPSEFADADDISGVDDEDGVTFPAKLSPGETATVGLFVNGGSGVVDAWIDFNDDGDWDDSGERIADHYAVIPGDNALSFSVPSPLPVRSFISRVRLSSSGVDAPTGFAADGEVEDGMVAVHTLASIDDAAAGEGDQLVFTVRLSEAAPEAVAISYTAMPGTAAAGVDYDDDPDRITGTLRFEAGQTQRTIRIDTLSDEADESDETLMVQVSAVGGPVSISDDTAVGTIQDRFESPTTVSIEDASADEGDRLRFTIRLADSRTGQVTVSYQVTPGTATAGLDYDRNQRQTTGTVNFGPDQTAATIEIDAESDQIDEPDETFNVELTGVEGPAEIADGVALGTIIDTNGAPLVLFDPSIEERSLLDDAGTIRFPVRIDGESPDEISIPFTVVSSDPDHPIFTILTPSPLRVPPSGASPVIELAIANGSLPAPQTLTVNLGEPINAQLHPFNEATVTIHDDATAPTIRFALAVQSVQEDLGFLAARVTLSAAVDYEVIVPYTVTEGTAEENRDYFTNDDFPIRIPAGQTEGAINLSIAVDRRDEPDIETFTLQLQAAGNAQVGDPSSLTVQILDDDVGPTVSLVPTARSINERFGFADVSFRLSEESSFDVLVPYLVSGNAGTSDVRLSPPSPILIRAGRFDESVNIQTINDNLDEPNETFVITLGTPTNASLGAQTVFTGTIVDDDGAPTVAFPQSAMTALEDAGTVLIAVQLSNASGNDVSVPFSTGGSTGTSDYDLLTASPLVIPAGSTSGFIRVAVIDDASEEVDETLVLTLRSATGADLGVTTTHTLTIDDNEAAPMVSFVSAMLSFPENAGTVVSRLTLSKTSIFDVTVPFFVSGGNADGNDYALLSASPVLIPAGSEGVDISVQLLDDSVFESDEELRLQLGSPTRATIGAPFTQTIQLREDDAAPSVSFQSAESSQNESDGPQLIAVNLSGQSAVEVRVGFIVSGSASASDFSSPTLSPLRFPPGASAASIVFDPTDDDLPESDETVVFTLLPQLHATLGAVTQHTAEIRDDDSQPILAFVGAARSVPENAGTVGVEVRLSSTRTSDVTVPITLTGSAGGADYTSPPATVTIPAGAISRTLNLVVRNDALDEPDETVVVQLGTPTQAMLGSPAVFTLTIQDDDPTPTLRFSAAVQTVGEGTASARISLLLSAASGFDVSVPFTLTGTAAAADFEDLPASPVLIPAGSSSVQIELAVVNDTLDEPDENLRLSIGTPTHAGLGSPATHTLTLLDNDTQPVVSFAVGAQSVGEASGLASVSVRLSQPSAFDVTVPFTVGGSSAPTDYSGLSTSPVTIPAGSTSATISLAVNDDGLDEPNETLNFSLGIPTRATAGSPRNHVLTIVDDDEPPAVSFALGSRTVAEDAGAVTAVLQLSRPSAIPITVPFTVGGSASTADYNSLSPISRTVNIPAGTTTANIRFNLTNDTLDEEDEVLILSLGSPTGAVVGAPSSQVITITDNDAGPSLRFVVATSVVNESPDSPGTLRVRLSARSGKLISVPYAVVGGTAGAADFTLEPGTLTFPAGQDVADIHVPVLHDTVDESSETVNVSLGAPVNASLAEPSTHTLTINDNDPSPTVRLVTAGQNVPEAASAPLTITIQQSAPSERDVTVPISVGGRARAGDDYSLSASSVSIPAGQTSGSLQISIVNDTLDERNEDIAMSLGVPINASRGSPRSISLTIVDDDP
ncbi:MAG: Calx-beta domain-containing protein [Panacagrimonas sp.]